MAIRASTDIAFVENSKGDILQTDPRDDRSQQRPAPPLWFDVLSLSFEGYRRLLLLRLRWHQRAPRQANSR